MNGIHDVGGKHGFGPVIPETDEPAFHAPWEGRMHGIAVTCQVTGVNTTPEQRKTIEGMSPALYLGTSYYEKWLYAYEKLLNEKGIVTTEELEKRVKEQAQDRIPDHPSEPSNPSDYAKKLRSVLYNGTPHDRPIGRPARFKVGDTVRARNINPTTHTRLPSFTKGKVGVVEVYHGAHCHHEALATGKGDVPEHLYAVKFTGQELWGGNIRPIDFIYVDLFENYLGPVD